MGLTSIDAGNGMVRLMDQLDPGAYVAHAVHGGDRAYVETNCFSDILIEVLHARGDEPLAAMGSTLRMAFEGDQWTFFKPAPEDLELLFGIDIHEMQPYRPLPAQIAEQIVAGRMMIVELDAWFLPDTAATSYRTEHVKTACAIEAIDPDGERLRYFHNAGYYELSDADFRGVFRLDATPHPDVLPPYVELVRFDAGPRLAGDELRAAARERFRHHLARRPSANPFPEFAEQLSRNLPELIAGTPELYHDYAFATVRMAGSGFEVCASAVEWLLEDDGAPAADALRRIVDGSKVLSFRMARRREFDPEPVITPLAEAWDEAMTRLDDALA